MQPEEWAERLVAHRGHARVAPENTLSAVASALAAGARFVEVDVQLAADGVPHLFHDRTLERLCGVPGRVADLDSAALAGLRASERGRFGSRFAEERVAPLADLVALVGAAPAAHVYVELKRASLEVCGPERMLAEVLPLLEPLAGRATLISFDFGVLELARRTSALPLGAVISSWEARAAPRTARLAPEVLLCDTELLPAAGPLVAPAPLVIYEVDDPAVARALVARGVTRIETFAIGELLAALSAGSPPPRGTGTARA